ncbi:eCIS core domain-containing protein [Streptomyces sp. NPDC001732]
MRPHDSAKAHDTGRRATAPARRADVDGPGPAVVSPRSLLDLQSTVGNAEVVRMLQRADRSLAEPTDPADPSVQRSAVHDVLRSGGRPLDEATRTDMEARFGADFSDVRIHTDRAARASAAEVGARAYTSGNHVVIGHGGADRHTLAHELTHVVQQRHGPVAGTDHGNGLRVSDPSDRFEREAEANARRIVSGAAPRPTGSADGPPPHGVSPVQRIMRLTDHDRRVYKDTNDETPDYAYLYHLRSLPLFVEHGAVDRFRQAASQAPNTPPAGHLPALGNVFFYDSASNALTRVDLDMDLSDRERRGLANFVSRNGPAIWRTGGGSRLPEPDGVLIATGTPSLNDALLLLGIPVEEHGQYAKVEFHRIKNPRQFRIAADGLREETGNTHTYESPDGNRAVFYASRVTQERTPTHRIRMGARSMGDDEFFGLDPNSETGRQIRATFESLPAPTRDTGWVPGTEIRAVGRGSGQDAAMGNWNALAAAACANHFRGERLPMDQNWEWLHVRGAQLGGATAGGNLVPGLYAANSAMIPWENMILQWASHDPARFWARFVADPVPNTPFARSISLFIRATDHAQLGTVEGQIGTFHPLHGKVVDKLAGEFIKRNADRTFSA